MTKKILFFTAPWCSGCRSLKPQLYKMIQGTDVQVEEIDVEAHPEEGQAYEITSLPTLFFIEDDAGSGAFRLVSHKVGNSPLTIQYIRHFIS